MERFRGKTISGLRWTYLTTFLTQGIYPLILLVLARLLTPADLGLMAMAFALVTLLNLFYDLGLKQALVQQEGNKADLANLVFWSLLPLGLFWCLLIWFLAPLVAAYFKDEKVISLLRALGFIFLIRPFSDVPLQILLRELKFKALFYRQLVPRLFSGGISIILALLGCGVWALVIGHLGGAIGTSLLVMLGTDWRPRRNFNVGLLKRIFRFGSLVSVQNVLGWLMVKADDLFVGRFLGAATLGIYRVGYTYGDLPWTLIGAPFNEVVYPILCRINDSPNGKGGMQDRYLTYIKWISLVSLPAGITFIAIVPFVIPPLLGSRWLATIPVLQLIGLTSIVGCIVATNAEIYKAIGKPEIAVKFFSVRVMVSLPAYFLAAQKSITALAITHVGLVCIFGPINMFICTRVLKIRLGDVLANIKTGLLLGILLGLLWLLYRFTVVDKLIFNPLGNAFCLAGICFLVSSVGLFLLDREAFNSFGSIIRYIFRHKEVTV